MGETKHTPGLWTVAVYSKKRFGLGRPGGGAFFLLQCVNDDTDSPAAIADAHLIAAAPKLLAACENAVQIIEQLIPEPSARGVADVVLHQLRAAIAEAKGGRS